MTDYLVEILYKNEYGESANYSQTEEDLYSCSCSDGVCLEGISLMALWGLNLDVLFGKIIRANTEIDKCYEDYKICSVDAPFYSEIKKELAGRVRRINKNILSYLKMYFYICSSIEALETISTTSEDQSLWGALALVQEAVPESFWSSFDKDYDDTEYLDKLDEIRASYSELASLLVKDGYVFREFLSLNNEEADIIIVRDYLIKHQFSLDGTYFPAENEVLLPEEMVDSFTRLFQCKKISKNLVFLGSFRDTDINKRLQDLFLSPFASLV